MNPFEVCPVLKMGARKPSATCSAGAKGKDPHSRCLSYIFGRVDFDEGSRLLGALSLRPGWLGWEIFPFFTISRPL